MRANSRGRGKAANRKDEQALEEKEAQGASSARAGKERERER